MTANDLLQREILSRIDAAQHADNVASATGFLWELIASKLIVLVGETGFTALFTRSLYLTQEKFPWLEDVQAPPPGDARFTSLQRSLEKQALSQASEASKALLLAFTQILYRLIGEPLTTGILSAALRDEATQQAGKEFSS